MGIRNFVKTEFSGWGRIERILFPLVIVLIISISLYMNDNKIALVSAICGISYTILAGKGKISCYYIGLMGTMCYAYLSYKNALYGNLALYALYYFPMQILGIFKWRKHLKSDNGEVVKTKLFPMERISYLISAVVITAIVSQLLIRFGDATPYIDAITTVFSIVGLILTVKRCVEQWYVWFIVNGLSVIMWVEAYINGSNCFATILMWITYFILSIEVPPLALSVKEYS
jgi:nicotinamide mononucleotide transporter